ncbi:MAG: glycosyltransferase family 4 protein [Burkholderiales bacterium]
MSQQVWMLGTAPTGQGGIASVLREYAAAGWFDEGAVRLLVTHHDRSRWGRVGPALSGLVRLVWALARGRVSLLHVHVSHGASFWRKLLLCLPAFLLRVPVLAHLHGSDFEPFYAEGGALRRACLRFMLRRSFRVLALSTQWCDWVRSVEPQARVQLMFNSLQGLSPEAAALEPAECPTALFLGRISERKGSFTLLQAFAQVATRVPSARLVVGGDGEVERFKAECQRLGLSERVDVLGWMDGAQKQALLRDAWLLVLPSHREGLPMAILEALAQGRPVISCPVGGIPEAVVAGATGLLVPPGNVLALAEALDQLLSDRPLARQMGVAALAHFQARFSHRANLPQLLALYREAGASRLPPLRYL